MSAARASFRRCGPPRRSVSQVLAAALRRRPELPAWPQLPRGRTLAAHQGRTAIARACSLLDIGPGDEVLMPSYNCGTEVDAVLASGARVVLYRVDVRGRVDAQDVRNRITVRTRAVYVTHYFGIPQDMEPLRELTRRGRRALIEDCALALFSSDGDEPLGAGADAAIYSFRKTLPVPDGGALVLRDGVLKAAAARTAPDPRRIWRRTLGLVAGGLRPPPRDDGAVRISREMPPEYRFDERTRDWDMSGMTRGLLADFDPATIVARRRANFARFSALIAGAPGVTPLFAEPPAGACPLGMPLVVADRDAWVARLRARGIDATPWWAGFHDGLSWEAFPEARHLKNHLVALPIHQEVDSESIDFMAACVRETASAAQPCGRRIARRARSGGVSVGLTAS